MMPMPTDAIWDGVEGHEASHFAPKLSKAMHGIVTPLTLSIASVHSRFLLHVTSWLEGASAAAAVRPLKMHASLLFIVLLLLLLLQ